MAPIAEKVADVTAEFLEVEKEILTPDLGVGDIPQWDSVAHLGLLHQIEKKFDFVLDVEEMIQIEIFEDLIDAVSKHVTA